MAQQQLADFLEVPQSRISEYTRDVHEIPKSLAFRLKEKLGWSLDYTYSMKASEVMREVERKLTN